MFYLCHKNPPKALELYQKSILKREKIEDFIKCFKEDYQYIKHHNIPENEYLEILEQLIEYRKGQEQ